jgi:hypothetical protein
MKGQEGKRVLKKENGKNTNRAMKKRSGRRLTFDHISIGARQHAFECFMINNMNMLQISEMLNIPYGVVKSISRKDDWHGRREERRIQMLEDFNANCEQLQRAARPEVINDALLLKRTINSKLHRALALNDEPSLHDLNKASQILDRTTKVGMNAAGVEKPQSRKIGSNNTFIHGGLIQVGVRPLGRDPNYKPEPKTITVSQEPEADF